VSKRQALADEIKGYIMTNLSKLSAAKLQALYEKRTALASKLCRDLINAGFGSEKHQDTRKRAAETGDALAVAYVMASDAQHECYDEEQARMRYHGSRKPIKRRA
jgi:hypothetical protein